MDPCRTALLLVSALWMSVAGAADAAATPSQGVRLSEGAQRYDLLEHVEYLEDPDGELTVEQLRDGAGGDRWSTSERPDPNFGFTSAVYWLRLRLHNPGDHTIRSVVAFKYALLDEIDAYVDRADGTVIHHELGDHHAFSSRDLPANRIAFVVDTEPGQSQWIHLRVRTDSSMQIGIDLHSYQTFIADSTTRQFLLGIYYGIMLAMALYNLFLYIAIRNRSYLLYVIFVVAFTGTQISLDGTSTRYLFGNLPGLANTFTPLIIGLTQIPPIWFTLEFLDTRRRHPRIHRALQLYMAASLVAPVLAFVAPYPVSIRVAAGFAIFTSIVCEAVGIHSLVRGYRPARFYVLAWTALIVGTVLYAMVSFGVIPANTFTINIQRVGSALEVTLLSFALGDSIKLLEQEREQARAEALALERDLALTGAVQHHLLPNQASVTEGRVSLTGFYRPATRCGGDWWWHERLEDGSVLVLLGDVTGHGAGAAMMTAAIAATYRSAARPASPDDVEETLFVLDRGFTDIAGELHHMSLVALTVTPDARRLRMWSAGGPPVFVMNASGDVTPLLEPGHLLGDAEHDLELGTIAHDLEPGDRIFAFSDGLPELAKPSGRQLGYRAVMRMFAETRALDLASAREHIARRLDDLRGDHPQDDDMTFVLIDAGA